MKALSPFLLSVLLCGCATNKDHVSISDLRMRLDRLRVGMTETETKRIVALEHKAELVHAGCSHSWANTYAPEAGYHLALSFTADRGFSSARMRDQFGMEEVWPR
jgi:biotin carboxylase